MFYELKRDNGFTTINLDNVETFIFHQEDSRVQVLFVDSESCSVFITLEEYECIKLALRVRGEFEED